MLPCLIFEDDHLLVVNKLDQQDLFSASQIIHLKPLVGEDTFRRFVAANPFVSRFYPNFRVSPVARPRSAWQAVAPD